MWLFSADIKPTPTPKPTPVHRLRMGDVDKRESGWWARTRSFLETGIAVGLFFWIPGTRVEIQTDHVKISN